MVSAASIVFESQAIDFLHATSPVKGVSEMQVQGCLYVLSMDGSCQVFY